MELRRQARNKRHRLPRARRILRGAPSGRGAVQHLLDCLRRVSGELEVTAVQGLDRMTPTGRVEVVRLAEPLSKAPVPKTFVPSISDGFSIRRRTSTGCDLRSKGYRLS